MAKKISPVGELLLEYYLLLQQKKKEKITQTKFAESIGMSKTEYSHFLTGRRVPDKERVDSLAEYFEDLRFYDAAGLERPDYDLFMLMVSWKKGRLKKEDKKKIAEINAPYITNNHEE